MPYLTKEKKMLVNYADQKIATCAGELNYCLSMACYRYLIGKGENYQTYNDIVGALENCKQEFYRRFISGYEDIKIQENGDVFEQPEFTSIKGLIKK